ncbi:serine/threonine-protein kinase atr [Coccinella septempunctata]|uniref:serine/threonine-protein kinase atr n=1 Tax=Coccinella septempunctata TaxID=41139 RepID=UPI001D07ED8B|nr:serine/threonine-protein kinase atr [Coccinella septempunctata]
MSSIEETILAFPSWKLLNDTMIMPDVFKKEESVTRLVSIIKSSVFENTFVHEKDPSLSYTEYQEIANMYKSFTTWILGRFFYAMSGRKLNRIHESLIDVQKYILLQLSKTQPNIYRDITIEYGKALTTLKNFYLGESNNEKEILQVFIPSEHDALKNKIDLSPIYVEITSRTTCINLLNNITQIIQPILVDCFMFYNFGEEIERILNNYLSILNKGTISLKLSILISYGMIVEQLNIHKSFCRNIEIILQKFYLYFENIICSVCDGTISLDEVQYSSLENVMVRVYNNFEFIKNGNFKCKRLTLSLYTKMFKKSWKYNISDEFLDIIVPHIQNLDINIGENYEDFLIEHLSTLNFFKICILKNRWKNDILKHCSQLKCGKEIKVYEHNVSKEWGIFCEIFLRKLEESHQPFIEYLEFFNKLFTLLLEITMEVQNFLIDEKSVIDATLVFFKEGPVFYNFVKKLSESIDDNVGDKLQDLYCIFLVNFMVLSRTKNLDVVFTIIAYPYLIPHIYSNGKEMPNQLIGFNDSFAFKKAIQELYEIMGKTNYSEIKSSKYLRYFIEVLSCGLLQNLNESHINHIQFVLLKICNFIHKEQNEVVKMEMLHSIPHIISIFPRSESYLNEFFTPNLNNGTGKILNTALSLSKHLLCSSYCDYIKVIILNTTGKLTIEIYCENCDTEIRNSTEKGEKLSQFKKRIKSMGPSMIFNFCRNKFDMSSLSSDILRRSMAVLETREAEAKICALKLLPTVARHLPNFISVDIVKIWLDKLEDCDSKVQGVLAKNIGMILKNSQENMAVSESVKKDYFDKVLETILELTKKSIRYSKFELQDTLLISIRSIIELQYEHTILPLFKIILYLIMVPTSKYFPIAINRLYYLAETHNKTPQQIYVSHTKEICDTLTHLCVVNQMALNYRMSTSLKKISMIFGFTVKDFVTKECQYLLPFLIAKIKTLPSVNKLIEEMAAIMDVELPELLASKYGYIFIHIFLNQETSGVYKAVMSYVENTTGLSGENLRRKNFRVILNNLLLHFHRKNREVVLALKLLVKEDTEKKTENIPEYLHSHFLGVLQFFLNTLISDENDHKETLRSLSGIISFMGSKHITPLRFKIISILQTFNYEKYPILVSEVWFTFLKCCEVEMLGPQLATIFKSLQPLMDQCPNEINKIYMYLICENETKFSEHIKDLFFMKNTKVSTQISYKLQSYLSEIERYTFKQKIKWLLKYLTHETIEIRVEGLKELNLLLEKNREELDNMILGYNGLDDSIVELIDILTSTCREKDKQLKLACAEVMGELGALEPSHLPRRYVRDTREFSFFIYEDNFVVNALNELIKALQAETNAVNMDRTALAIQEILKTYHISPDEKSSKHSIWKQFTESQQELMKPLLSSRYISALNSLSFDFTIPIFGSNLGSTFETWLYNWACSLISKLPTERRTLLEGCLPSMKEGERILMHFLPHILLHSLIEGNCEEAAYDEFQAVLSSFSTKHELDNSIVSVVAVPMPGASIVSQTVTQKEFWKNQCTKTVFILLDFLDRWLREWQCLKRVAGRNDPNFKKIKNFLSRFCKLQLANCNYRCGEYPRALMYLEDFITENPIEMAENLSFLAEIYAQLDEPDGVAGTMALRNTEPSIEDRILALEVSGKLADAAACYERIKPPLKLRHIQGLMQCYLDLDNVNTALNFVYGALNTYDYYGNMLLEMQAEPLWRLGSFDHLNQLLKRPELVNNKSWGVQIGKALIHFGKGERNEFQCTLESLKLQQVDSLGAASLVEGAYQHGYGYIARLHSLNELQQVEKCMHSLLVQSNDNKLIERVINDLKGEWELRLKVVQESVRIMEPILCMRRVALEQGKKLIEEKLPNAIPYIDALLGECWLLSVKTARSARVHQQAFTYTLKAEEYAPAELFIEKARLHWLREENEQAMTTLKRGLDKLLHGIQKNYDKLSLDQRKLCAEARLLFATYNDSTSNVEADITLQNYKDAYEVYKGWEKTMVCLGQYYDRRFQSLPPEERDSKSSDLQIVMINYFGGSLLYGSTFVYQSLPRLLSIWFDYGTRLLDVTISKVREERRTNLLKMTHLIDNFLQKLPVYIFLTAFSQLVSRICHPQKEVYIELKSIIIKLLLHYPQQTLWMLIPIMKSSYAMRVKRCSEIFNDPKLRSPPMIDLIKDFTALAEKLIELCNKDIPNDVSTTSVNSLLRSLPRMLSKGNFSEIMIPTHKFRKLVLPNPDIKKSDQHNPFPNQYVHIVGIQDEMTILTSLQRPRKIILRGSDGKGYIQMLKPKDDLRKDFRLMEFNDIVNQLLARDAEARERRLNIRLYSVAPLNEECGLIEWVPNLLGLRPILMGLYNQNGLGMRNSELREVVCDLKDPLSKKRDVFVKRLLVRHPPILGEWFRRNFPDAQSWLTARTAFIRTTAVMSMVGYILGLGDRHGENISIDSTSGDTVHVDFNCLFNKGESLEYPERVPFRLTHNMVSAMGPLGVEGMFRKSCVCTLGVLRTNTATLMSIVTPFVYDPLVSWTRISVQATGAERTNDQAFENIKNIELRLQGVIKYGGRTQSLSPLSVEGQTNYLIKEAMSIDNLCQMYYGWGPFL